MITAGGLFLGLAFAAMGFLAVWKSYWFRQNIGDINELIGYPGATWLNWDTVGVFLLFIGLLTMVGLLQLGLVLFLGPMLG